MPRIAYEGKKIGAGALAIIRSANTILDDYAEQGFDLTLRQLYYQFVAHDLFPDDRRWTWIERTRRWVRDPEGTKNADPNYKWLGDIVNTARLTGRMDWSYIVDRTRELEELPHWDAPVNMIEQAAKQFRVELWADQPEYVEVWIEKDALIGVIEGTCKRYDVPYFSCRGYTSQSEMWSAGRRLGEQIARGKKVTILHLGDHDPSGIDMTRDIEDRLTMFIGTDYVLDAARSAGIAPGHMSEANVEITLREAISKFSVQRIALNMDQVEQYGPPPNPAKLGDSRSTSYVEQFGHESWELDALEPSVLAQLISEQIEDLIEPEAWQAAVKVQRHGRALLERAADQWDELSAQLEDED